MPRKPTSSRYTFSLDATARPPSGSNARPSSAPPGKHAVAHGWLVEADAVDARSIRPPRRRRRDGRRCRRPVPAGGRGPHRRSRRSPPATRDRWNRAARALARHVQVVFRAKRQMERGHARRDGCEYRDPTVAHTRGSIRNDRQRRGRRRGLKAMPHATPRSVATVDTDPSGATRCTLPSKRLDTCSRPRGSMAIDVGLGSPTTNGSRDPVATDDVDRDRRFLST